MRSRAAIVLAMTAVGVWGIHASLASSDRKTAPDRDELIRLENEWVTTADLSFFERALADDEVHITRSGVMTDKKAEIEYYRNHLAERQGQKTRFEDLKVRFYGDIGVVNGTTIVATSNGQTRKNRFTGVFQFRDGRWQAINLQETPFDSPEPASRPAN